jgi:hypothetical protein
LEPLAMCFKTTPYHLPVKRSDTSASYLIRFVRHGGSDRGGGAQTLQREVAPRLELSSSSSGRD